ncbi:MAG: YncE family protein [Candidatus Nitrosopolaris sp.]
MYVANSGSNTISVIDGYDNRINYIPVKRYPTGIALNPETNKIYVANSGSNTVSVIDGSADKVSAGIIFNIEPANSGDIWCNNKEYPTNVYLYVANGTKCIARPDKDFEFSNWIENLGHNSTVPLSRSVISDSHLNSFLSTLGMKPNDTSATFDVNRFGIFAATFKSVPPPIPFQYWIPLYGLIGSTIIGWSLPTIIGSIRARTKRKESVKLFDDLVTSISNATDRQSLDGINNQVIRAYISEKINEFQYKILDKRISEYYNIIDKRDISANQHNKRSPI